MHHFSPDSETKKLSINDPGTDESPTLSTLPIDDLLDLIRHNEGPSATILWLLFLSDKGHTVEELVRSCSYPAPSVESALKRLQRHKIVEYSPLSGWSLVPAFRHALLHWGSRRTWSKVELNEATGDSQVDELGRLLRHIGIASPAYDWLLAREDLQADPSHLVAWWWHYLTETWPDNRAGLVIRRLLDGHRPPDAFLTLARTWPQVAEADRYEMEQLVWRNWPSSLMAHTFADLYPAMTGDVFDAYQALHAAAPEELDY